jgi:hypothetical protein
MNDKGLSYVCAPVPTKNGLSVQANGALIVLYEFIDAKNGYDYDLQSFGKALGTLHALTPRLTAKLPLRGFSSLREEFLIETLPRLSV